MAPSVGAVGRMSVPRMGKGPGPVHRPTRSHILTMVSSSSSSEKCLFKSLAHFLKIVLLGFFFFFWLSLSCVSSSYILENHLLSDISFANILPHSVGGLFTLLIASFAVQKF